MTLFRGLGSGGLALSFVLIATIAFFPHAFAAPADVASDGPGLATVQSAYDLARADGRDRHFDDLKIHQADCQSLGEARYVCQIAYLLENDPQAGRLYFTIVSLERSATGSWILKSGLCRSDVPR